MLFDYKAFFKDHSIECYTSGKNVTYGWINVQCPFCDDHSNHLGFNPNDSAAGKDEQFKGNCWRCGGHSLYNYISKVKNYDSKKILGILDDYSLQIGIKKRVKKAVNTNKSIILPGKELTRTHRLYLRQRGFRPKEMIELWGVQGTGPVEKRKGWKQRVIIPIIQDGELVSYQGRDITEKSPIKYNNCSKEFEITSLKDCIYGIDYCTDSCVVVEGVMDVWKLGPGAVCTFGTKFTKKQVALLSRIPHVFIYYDPEPDAQKQAEKLAYSIGGNCKIIKGDTEPGELTMQEGDDIMRQLNIRF